MTRLYPYLINKNLIGESITCVKCKHLIIHTTIFHHLYEKDAKDCKDMCESSNEHDCLSQRSLSDMLVDGDIYLT